MFLLLIHSYHVAGYRPIHYKKPTSLKTLRCFAHCTLGTPKVAFVYFSPSIGAVKVALNSEVALLRHPTAPTFKIGPMLRMIYRLSVCHIFRSTTEGVTEVSVIHVFVSHIHFLRLLSAGDWGGRRASAGANLLRFFFFPRKESRSSVAKTKTR